MSGLSLLSVRMGGGGGEAYPFSLLHTNPEESPVLHALSRANSKCPTTSDFPSFSLSCVFLLYINDFHVCMVQLYIYTSRVCEITSGQSCFIADSRLGMMYLQPCCGAAA